MGELHRPFFPLSHIYMASSSTTAYWVSGEEVALINFLYDHIAEAGDNGSFKKTTFVSAAAHIAPFWQRGARKTAKMCQNKYSAVSFIAIFDLLAYPFNLVLIMVSLDA